MVDHQSFSTWVESFLSFHLFYDLLQIFYKSLLHPPFASFAPRFFRPFARTPTPPHLRSGPGF